jgi:hypothetical protein
MPGVVAHPAPFGWRRTPLCRRRQCLAALRRRNQSGARALLPLLAPLGGATHCRRPGGIPGSRRSALRGRVGRRLSVCGGCVPKRTPMLSPPSRSRPLSRSCLLTDPCRGSSSTLATIPFNSREALGKTPAAILVRLRSGRCFYAEPTTQPHTGRPRRHGHKFVCDAPQTWPAPAPAPADDLTVEDEQYGTVRVRAWTGPHPGDTRPADTRPERAAGCARSPADRPRNAPAR